MNKRFRVTVTRSIALEGTVTLYADDDSEACELAAQYAADGMVAMTQVNAETVVCAEEEELKAG